MMNWTTAQSAEIATIAACVIAAVSLLGLASAALWNAKIHMADLRQREFETYHALIRTAVGDPEKSETMFTDRQIATIYELRRYKEYHSVTERILNSLKEAIKSRPTCDELGPRTVCKEADLTLEAITRYRK